MQDESFLIEESDLVAAKNICKYEQNLNLQKKYIVNELAISIAKKYFADYDTDIDSGLHNVCYAIPDAEVSDIYVKGAYIEVVAYYEDEEISLPKQNDYIPIPTAYMFVKLDRELTNGTVSGFFINEFSDGLTEINEDTLHSKYDLESFLVNYDDVDVPKNFSAIIYRYLDKHLDNIENFYRILFSSQEARIDFLKIVKAQTILSYVATSQDAQTDVIQKEQTERFDDELNSSTEDGLLLEQSVEDDLIDNTLDYSSDIEDVILTKNEQTDDVQLDLAESAEEEQIYGNSIDGEIQNNDLPDVGGDVSDIVYHDDNDEQFADNQYATQTTQSLQNLELELEQSDVAKEHIEEAENYPDVEADDSRDENSRGVSETSDEIEGLFNNKEQDTSSQIEEYIPAGQKNNRSGAKHFIVSTVIIAIIATGGYLFYSKKSSMPETIPYKDNVELQNNQQSSEDAMPDESVTTENDLSENDEATSLEIPAIEKNIDTSILVSNLSVDWEVPAGYISNAAARRYFTRIGKIIQLNLKSELLLINKVPITNKIMVELSYDKASGHFKILNVNASSGEPVVDNAITKAVQSVLDRNSNGNISVFNNMQGNPILVIHL